MMRFMSGNKTCKYLTLVVMTDCFSGILTKNTLTLRSRREQEVQTCKLTFGFQDLFLCHSVMSVIICLYVCVRYKIDMEKWQFKVT